MVVDSKSWTGDDAISLLRERIFMFGLKIVDLHDALFWRYRRLRPFIEWINFIGLTIMVRGAS